MDWTPNGINASHIWDYSAFWMVYSYGWWCAFGLHSLLQLPGCNEPTVPRVLFWEDLVLSASRVTGPKISSGQVKDQWIDNCTGQTVTTRSEGLDQQRKWLICWYAELGSWQVGSIVFAKGVQIRNDLQVQTCLDQKVEGMTYSYWSRGQWYYGCDIVTL